ncbi:MAG: DUF4294 domain-containing protein [Saprospiraceae bacterium]
MKHPILITLIFLFLTNGLSAQTDSTRSAWARLEVDQGDSVYIMSLRPVRIMSKRKFKDFTEQRQYYLYKRAAKKVYPYAIQALEIYADINEETDGMKKRKRKKYIKNEHKELKEDFEAKMKKLSKTEGKVTDQNDRA